MEKTPAVPKSLDVAKLVLRKEQITVGPHLQTKSQDFFKPAWIGDNFSNIGKESVQEDADHKDQLMVRLTLKCLIFDGNMFEILVTFQWC